MTRLFLQDGWDGRKMRGAAWEVQGGGAPTCVQANPAGAVGGGRSGYRAASSNHNINSQASSPPAGRQWPAAAALGRGCLHWGARLSWRRAKAAELGCTA